MSADAKTDAKKIGGAIEILVGKVGVGIVVRADTGSTEASSFDGCGGDEIIKVIAMLKRRTQNMIDDTIDMMLKHGDREPTPEDRAGLIALVDEMAAALVENETVIYTDRRIQ